MLTGNDLKGELKKAFPRVEYAFRFPTSEIRIIDERFAGKDEDEREALIAELARLSVSEIRETAARTFLLVTPLTPAESLASTVNRGYFWSRSLLENRPTAMPVEGSPKRVLHFYGFKGGQARTTVLAYAAVSLAEAGWRVLAVDLDAEAPSLDLRMGVATESPGATVVGLRAGLAVEPVRVPNSSSPQGGWVDLVPFRPRSERFDLDAAALALELSVHPVVAEQLAAGIARAAAAYDVVFIDHRTGLSPIVQPVLHRLPGSLALFVRLDGQWEHSRGHLAALWRLRPEAPGVLVSFRPNLAEEEAVWRARVKEQVEPLLQDLADARALATEDPSGLAAGLTPDDVADHWVIWPYDAAFDGSRLPGPRDPGREVLTAIEGMRRVLRLTAPPVRVGAGAVTVALHASGAVDEGDLIQTAALRDLSAPGNPFAFIVGRKGTGKTRLLRALADLSLGEPLLVPNEDAGSMGVPSSDAAVAELRRRTAKHPDDFWWTLLHAAVLMDSAERSTLSDGVHLLLDEPEKSLWYLTEWARGHSAAPRTFLIDGLETAFPRDATFDYLAALFRVMATLDVDRHLQPLLRIKVFIRTDLARRGFENFEQQSEGRRLELLWETGPILNFALSRLRALPWFREEFGGVCQEIDSRYSEILQGHLPQDECDRLLLKVFPERLRRLNLNTTTFLRTYFSDDPTGRGSYYPRIYDGFLRVIARGGSGRLTATRVVDGRINEELIHYAHEIATQDFLDQVRAELNNLIDLPERDLQNLINAFKSTITPFVVEERVGEIVARTGLSQSAVRSAMERMKTLGIFEDRPKFHGQWRAGRLFKTSLGMLLDRKRRKEDDADPS